MTVLPEGGDIYTVVGVDDGNGDVVHLQPEQPVPDGRRVY